MILAKIDGKLVYPRPGLKAQCPACKEEVVAKCGSINIWHWSHKNDTECDSWSEPETQWHYNWKTLYPLDCVEVSMGKNRADVFYMNRVIEFQHSTISAEEIAERESFYGNMIWILDGNQFVDNLEFSRKYDEQGNIKKFGSCRWKWRRSSWLDSKKPIFIQVGIDIYRVTKFWEKEYTSNKSYRGFYYEHIVYNDFKKQYLNLRIPTFEELCNEYKRVI